MTTRAEIVKALARYDYRRVPASPGCTGCQDCDLRSFSGYCTPHPVHQAIAVLAKEHCWCALWFGNCCWKKGATHVFPE